MYICKKFVIRIIFMIEIKNLTKKFGQNLILDNLSFSAAKGEILGFLGPNGAGKTTTMKIITSFWQPTSGQVLIDGLDTAADSLATRKKIGYLPETVPLYEDMRVLEYLRFIAEIRWLEKDKIKARIDQVASICGLNKVLFQTIDELSKGFRQRLGLAQAIMHQPDFLILDEPTTGLDPNQIVEIRDLIKTIGREKTVIFSTHILSEVSATCDRVIIINNGRIVGQGSPRELVAKSGGRELIYVKIKGPQAEVLKQLKEMENVIDINVKDREAEDIYGYEVEPKPGVDMREYLSMTVMKNNWSILEFSRQSASLESVFRELTK